MINTLKGIKTVNRLDLIEKEYVNVLNKYIELDYEGYLQNITAGTVLLSSHIKSENKEVNNNSKVKYIIDLSNSKTEIKANKILVIDYIGRLITTLDSNLLDSEKGVLLNG